MQANEFPNSLLLQRFLTAIITLTTAIIPNMTNKIRFLILVYDITHTIGQTMDMLKTNTSLLIRESARQKKNHLRQYLSNTTGNSVSLK